MGNIYCCLSQIFFAPWLRASKPYFAIPEAAWDLIRPEDLLSEEDFRKHRKKESIQILRRYRGFTFGVRRKRKPGLSGVSVSCWLLHQLRYPGQLAAAPVTTKELLPGSGICGISYFW